MGIVYASDLDGTLLGTEKALSDRTVEIVNRLIKQFNEMKKMMKMFTGSQKSMKKRGSFAGLPFFK